MCLTNSQLDEYILRRELIAITRGELESNKIQGFPLAYSPQLLLMRYVYDFHFDGLLLLRRIDITDSVCRETDRFQRKLLATENRLKRGLFRSNYSVESFASFLRSMPKNKIVVMENESADSGEFYIGRLVSVDSQFVRLQEFSGAGNWERNVTEISTDELTCCQIETNYINFYARYFERTSYRNTFLPKMFWT